MGFFARLIDDVDFPDLDRHDGDYQLHDTRTLQEPILQHAVLDPTELASVDIESAGQRTVPSAGQVFQLFTVGRMSAIGGGSLLFQGGFTNLWLTSS